MENALLLNLTLEGGAEPSLEERQAADQLLERLEADLQEFNVLSTSTAMREIPDAGLQKGGVMGTLLGMGVGHALGILTAEVNGEMVAIQIIRHLLSTLKNEGKPYELEMVHRRTDGTEITFRFKGPAQDPAALLTQVQSFLALLFQPGQDAN